MPERAPDGERERYAGTRREAGLAVAEDGPGLCRGLVGRGSEAQCPSLPFRRPEAAEGVFRGMSPGGGIR